MYLLFICLLFVCFGDVYFGFCLWICAASCLCWFSCGYLFNLFRLPCDWRFADFLCLVEWCYALLLVLVC